MFLVQREVASPLEQSASLLIFQFKSLAGNSWCNGSNSPAKFTLLFLCKGMHSERHAEHTTDQGEDLHHVSVAARNGSRRLCVDLTTRPHQVVHAVCSPRAVGCVQKRHAEQSTDQGDDRHQRQSQQPGQLHCGAAAAGTDAHTLPRRQTHSPLTGTNDAVLTAPTEAVDHVSERSM